MPSAKRCGVYLIRHDASGRLYVGSSKNVAYRWYAHRRDLKLGEHHSRYLQAAWTKYGEVAFAFEVIEECDIADLLGREQHYIDTLRPAFNICHVAGSREGVPHSEEVREKMKAFQCARAALRTHCPHGHLYDEANTYLGKKGERICRACNAERVSAVYANETPEQREARRQRADAYYEATKDAQSAARKAYQFANVEAKRAYDTDPANRAKANERKRQALLSETAQQREARLERKRQSHQRHRAQNLAKMRAYHASRGADAQKKEA